MKITKEELLHTIKLANLKFDSEEIGAFKTDLEEFLTFAEQLDDLDLSGVCPTINTYTFEGELRQDDALPSLDKNNVLLNTKSNNGSGIVVPRIVE